VHGAVQGKLESDENWSKKQRVRSKKRRRDFTTRQTKAADLSQYGTHGALPTATLEILSKRETAIERIAFGHNEQES
jgi:hypothetical protein